MTVQEAAKLAREMGLALCFEQLRTALIAAEPDNAATIRVARPATLLAMAEGAARSRPERTLEEWQRELLALPEVKRRERFRWLGKMLDAA